jgi:hypothetical protein
VSHTSQGSKRRRMDLSAAAALQSTRPASPASSDRTSIATYAVAPAPGTAENPQTPKMSQTGQGQHVGQVDEVFDPFALKPPGSAERPGTIGASN